MFIFGLYDKQKFSLGADYADFTDLLFVQSMESSVYSEKIIREIRVIRAKKHR